MKSVTRPNIPANSAPDDARDAADHEREHDRQAREHLEAAAAPLSVSYGMARNAPAKPDDPGREREHHELRLEDVHADRHRRRLAVAQRDEPPPERAAPQRDDTDAAHPEHDGDQDQERRRGRSRSRAEEVQALEPSAPAPTANDCEKNTTSTSAANASVASARYRPWSRIAGKASNAPIGMQIDRGEHDRPEAAVRRRPAGRT